MKVIVDHIYGNLLYESYYIYGLSCMVGRENVMFSSEPFMALSECKGRMGVFLFMAKGKRFAISYNDSYEIIEPIYDWCDVYGSVNANFSKTPEKFHDKLVSLCPSFGIQCWNYPTAFLHVAKDLFKIEGSVRKYIGKYKRMLQRPKYQSYVSYNPSFIDNNYIFFLSTLWYSDEWNKNDEGVNARRANFIRACKELTGVIFEGGLVSQGKDRSSEDLFADCLSEGKPMKEWMEKTKRSALVFNTPAFWDCHGWKLGEYLAMGKCIVSTRLSNDLPVPLEHGKNIHFVEDDMVSITEVVQYIVKHREYRTKLENGARDYWNLYGSPVASLRLLGVD